jgi:hypothetical protein
MLRYRGMPPDIGECPRISGHIIHPYIGEYPQISGYDPILRIPPDVWGYARGISWIIVIEGYCSRIYGGMARYFKICPSISGGIPVYRGPYTQISLYSWNKGVFPDIWGYAPI